MHLLPPCPHQDHRVTHIQYDSTDLGVLRCGLRCDIIGASHRIVQAGEIQPTALS